MLVLWLIGCPYVFGPPDLSRVDAVADTAVDGDSDTDADSDTDVAPDADSDGSPDEDDCDDEDPAVFPGAPDLCGDDRVTDCDRSSDDGLVTVDGALTFSNLAAALDAASEGSALLVCPGTYVGAFTATGPVTVASHGGADVTTLDGGQLGTTLSVQGGTTVSGLTITGGQVPGRGGGIAQLSVGDLTVTDCVITGNRGQLGGGIRLSGGSSAVISGTEVSNNVATDGGGGIYVPFGTVADLTGTTVDLNSAPHGGGVLVEGSGTLIGGVVTANEADSTEQFINVGLPNGGGGVATVGDVVLTGTEISGNTSSVVGGGLSLTSGISVLTDVSVTANVATGTGGGLLVFDSEVELTGTTLVSANEAGLAGGAYVNLGRVTGGVFSGNNGTGGGGGALVWDGTLVDVTLEANTGFDGGGVWAYSGEVQLAGGRVVSNTATSRGGGVAIPGPLSFPGGIAPVLTMDGTELADNVAQLGGGLYVDGADAVLIEVIVARNRAFQGGGASVLGSTHLTSEACDWSIGVDDNDPSDVFAGTEVSGYGAAESFDCSSTACTPIP